MLFGYALAAFAASGLLHAIPTMFPYVQTLLSNLFARHHKKIEAASALAVKKAIDGDEILRYLSERQDKLEAEVKEHRTMLDAAEKRGERLERVLERVARGYNDLRSIALKIARRSRDGESIEPELLDELEATPNVEKMLQGVISLGE